jgi:osmotically-inducible protein OsmY
LIGGLTAALPGGWHGRLDGLTDAAGLDLRVSARLRWDKTLSEAPIDVQTNGAVVELRGKVRDLTQRRRAVELAGTTAGVEKVNDLLEMESP